MAIQVQERWSVDMIGAQQRTAICRLETISGVYVNPVSPCDVRIARVYRIGRECNPTQLR